MSVVAISSFLVAFVICISILPFLIIFLKKEKAKQTILHYVEAHASKQGTPTLGGLSFLFACAISCAIFFSTNSKLAVLSLIITFSYGLLGFLDDYLKIKLKQNLGLRAYQKLIFQFAMAILVSVFVFRTNLVGTKILIPFSSLSIDLKWGIIPFTILVFLACTNSVNLTDGLDGLATSTVFICLLMFSGITIFMISIDCFSIKQLNLVMEYKNLIILSLAMCGALLGFLCFNTNPAKIFMGDTGSMALGALVACFAIFTRNSLFIPFFGLVFVASSVSVFIQVAYYKKTKKRVFLMAPLHHHFEMKGVKEQKIVVIYSVVALIVGLTSLLIELLVVK